GADVAWLFDPIEHGHQRIGLHVKIGKPQAPRDRHGHHAFGPIAEGKLLEHFRRNLPGMRCAFAGPADDRFAFFAARARLANEHLVQLDAGIDRTGNLAHAVDQRPPLLRALPAIAQLGRVLHTLILNARDELRLQWTVLHYEEV